MQPWRHPMHMPPVPLPHLPHLPPMLDELARRFPSIATQEEESAAIDAALQQGLESLGYPDYRFRSFRLAIGTNFSEGTSAWERLRIPSDLGIRSASRLLATVESAGYWIAALTYVPDTDDAPPVRVQHSTAVSAWAKAEFLDDLTRLAAAGYVHRWAARGHAHWLLVPATGRIMLDDDSWLASLDPVDPRRLDSYIASLHRLVSELPTADGCRVLR